MVIVYLSIALAVLALIYLGVSAFRTFKAIQPTMKSMSDTAAKLQNKIEGIKKETNHLKEKGDEFRHDFKEKKRIIQDTMTNIKWSGEEMKSLWHWTRAIPNPRRVDRVKLSPELQRIEDRIVELLVRWKKIRE